MRAHPRGCLVALTAVLGLASPVIVTHVWVIDGIDGALLRYVAGSEDTLYSSGYTDWRWRRVHLGMSRAEVDSLLGPPIDDCLPYEERVACRWSKSANSSHYRVRSLNFDATGRVVAKFSEFYFD